MKVVLDTNVLVSAAIVKKGIPAQIIKHQRKPILITSEEILTEVEEVLRR